MGKYTINHKACPECGNRLRHYYFYCGNCGSYNVVNWLMTFKIWLVVIVIIAIIFTPLLLTQYKNIKTQCQSNPHIAAIVAGFGWNCKNGK